MPPQGLHLRDATPQDASALHRLYHEAYAVHARAGRGGFGALRDSLDDVRGYIAEGLVRVAEDAEGALVGTVMSRRIANIRRLAVAPARKGEGVGSWLLDEAVERARREGYSFAQLDTSPDDPWLPEFYRRHGFEDRSIERFPDGSEWLALRRRLR